LFDQIFDEHIFLNEVYKDLKDKNYKNEINLFVNSN